MRDVLAADIYGGRSALKVTSAIPVAMAAGFLLLVLYFIGKGGYKAIHLTGEEASGGLKAPAEY